MSGYLASLAVIGGAICSGIATVQQKLGADRERNVHSFDLTLLLRLLRDVPYLTGIILTLVGYGLSLIALQVLPLFLVQSLMAASVVVTALGERLFLHKKLHTKTYVALGAAVVGLGLLGVSSVATHARLGNTVIKLVLEVLPVLLGVVGILSIYVRGHFSAALLAVLGGISFGNTSMIGRILVYPHPLWKLIENPLLYSLIISGILGQYLFTISLQRTSATKGNALMISLQTIMPAAFGLIFFGDKIRSGFPAVVAVGVLLVIVGSIFTAIGGSRTEAA